MTNASELFRKNLKKILEREGKSVADLERLTGIRRTTLGQYLKDQSPNLDYAARIAAALGLTLGELLGESGEHSLVECLNRIERAVRKNLDA